VIGARSYEIHALVVALDVDIIVAAAASASSCNNDATCNRVVVGQCSGQCTLYDLGSVVEGMLEHEQRCG